MKGWKLMEVKEKSKKRELIKTIAIIFLVILLILTFFSNTFMNYSLPEVATQMVSSGTINAKIRGSGSVSANESYEVIINQTREVRSVCVKVGDAVQQGDLLFVLGDIESEELKNAQEQLQTLELDYQKQILNLSKQYASDDLTVRGIQLDLERAIAQRDENLVTDAEVSYAKGDLAAARSQLSQTELILGELNASQGDDEQTTEAREKVAELTTKVNTLTEQAKGYEEELEKLDTGASLDAERKIQDAKNALDKAQTKWAADWAGNLTYLRRLSGFTSLSTSPHAFSSSEQVEIERQLSNLKQQEEDIKQQYQNWTPTTPPGDEDGGGTTKPADTYDYIYERVRAAYDAVLASQAAMETAQETYNRALEDKDSASSSTAQQRQVLQQKLNAARQELSAAQIQLREAQAQLDAAANSNSQLKNQIKVYESSKRDLESRIADLEANLTALEEKKKLHEAALDLITEKQKALEEALSGKDIDKQLNNLDLQAKRLEIERQQALVAKYKEESVDTEITSKVSGVVRTINVTAGKENTSGEAMAVIDVIDRGYTIKISVTNEQAKAVKIGDTAEVTNYRWSDITATLEAITSDPSAPGQKKFLVFRVTGEIEAGSNISLSIGQKSTVMDTVVPKSALREDTNGKFVLVVTSKSTPLGNRYTATRVDVQVLAEDDNNVAVTGVAANDYVITTSSKPLDPGSLVRMVENP